MKNENKFTLEKFQVAKLKNMKKISGGNGTEVDNTIVPTTGGTSGQDKDGSNGICLV